LIGLLRAEVNAKFQ